MTKNTISIIGCGWFGLPLGKHLVENGYQVNGSTTQSEKLAIIAESGITPFQITLTPKFEGDQNFFNADIIVINVPPGKNTEETYQTAMITLRNLVNSGQIHKVILISSTSVYPNTNGVVTEKDADYKKTPRSGISLLKIEDLWNEVSDFKITTLRFAGLYGPNRNPGRFLSNRKATGAQNPVNMVHLTDCIGAVKTVIENNLWGDVFNICSPIHPSREDFYQKATHKSELPPPIFEEPSTGNFKEISAKKFLQASTYNYQFPNPLEGIDSL